MTSRYSAALIPTLLALISLSLCSCGDETVEGPGEATLTLSSIDSVSVARGQEVAVDVSIERSNWEGVVAISFEGLPDGVALSDNSVIAADEDARTYTLIATSEAKLVSDHLVAVKARMGDHDRFVHQTFFVTVTVD